MAPDFQPFYHFFTIIHQDMVKWWQYVRFTTLIRLETQFGVYFVKYGVIKSEIDDKSASASAPGYLQIEPGYLPQFDPLELCSLLAPQKNKLAMSCDAEAKSKKAT